MNPDFGPRDVAAEAKLPLWDTIVLSYSTYFSYFADVLRISWLWLAACGVLMAVVGAWQWTFMAELIGQTRPPHLQPVKPPNLETMLMPTGTSLAMHISSIIFVLAGASIAVAWHRRITLGEPAGFCGGNIAAGHLWRYVGNLLLIGLTAFVPVLVALLAYSVLFLAVGLRSGAAAGLVIFFGNLAAMIVMITVMLRLSLVLPARAIDDRDLTFKQCWRRVRGSTWRMLWGILACAVVPVLPAQIVFMKFFHGTVLANLSEPRALAGGDFVTAMTVLSVGMLLYFLLVLPIPVGFLSIAYWRLFARR